MKEMNSIILYLAWRNLWKNKRRSALTLTTIAMATGMILFMNALQKGGQAQMIEDAAAANTAHIQIHEKGFWENLGIEYAFIPGKGLLSKLDRLASENAIEAYSIRLHAEGLIAFKNNTSGCSIQAVDPVRELKVTRIHEKIIRGGRYLAPGDAKHLVIGKDLAKSLGVGVGDLVSMLSQGFDGSIAAENLSIVGLFQTGTPEHDRYLAFVPLGQAMETFSMMGHINSIAVRLARTDDIPPVREALRGVVDAGSIEVMDCYELMPDLMQHLEMDRYPALVFNFILLMVALFGIFNTMQMSVFERTREFGIMLAIGTRPGQVTGMIIWEATFMAVIGVAAGLALGSLGAYYFILNPIDYSGVGDDLAVYGISSNVRYSPWVTVTNLVVTMAVVAASSVLFSLLPALKAGRMRPVEAIHHL